MSTRSRFAKWSESQMRVFLRATEGTFWRWTLRRLRVEAELELSRREREARRAEESGPFAKYGVN